MMRRIDRETVQRITDAADIVDVVSDFVTLKRRGANYTGLCPFHNERTPSFSVSRSKGICKCFSCGKGGSAVNFIMEIEQISYYEALKYLAKKYGIEIQERELTTQEREAETARESMMAVNDFAMKHFQHNLKDTAAGRDIGLAYFRERGINDAMIERFRLGYALEERTDLLDTAKRAGYTEKYLVDTGLCSRNEQGRVYDRFRGRVIYPVFTVSGKVVAFGGRTLRTDKSMAKYVNSPESIIYSKRAELYGLYQAKQAINKKNKCILVEGYMDVISMHQSGIENVVASSGTSLTDRQVNLIHRFTENVTVIYDSDAAGIKASLRGIDMLLAEGLNVKVLLLPEGDDPDSFAQNHSSSEVEAYLAEHETDFIRFKTRILLQGVDNDPIARSHAITEIVRSISVIPSEISRSVYIQECSRMLGIDEGVLTKQTVRFIAENLRKSREDRTRQEQRDKLDSKPDTAESEPEIVLTSGPAATPTTAPVTDTAASMRKYEEQVLKFVLKYGMAVLCDAVDEAGNSVDMTVLDYIVSDLHADDITIANPDIARAMAEAVELSHGEWEADWARFRTGLTADIAAHRSEGERHIRETATDTASIDRMERELQARLADESEQAQSDFRDSYIARRMVNHPDDTVRRLATELVTDKYVLSKIHTKYAHVETERERLVELVPRALFEYKDGILENELAAIRSEIRTLTAAGSPVDEPMTRLIDMTRKKSELAKYLGDRTIVPPRSKR